MAKIIGRGAPSSNTYGILGQEYIDKLTGKRYICTKSDHVTDDKVGEADHYCEWAEEGAGGGASSWNDLKDKPFGEYVKNDTLAIDWDTFVPTVEGESSEVRGLTKVSDIIVTLDDFINGASLTPMHGCGDVREFSYDEIASDYNEIGCVMLYSGYGCYAVFVPYDNFVIDGAWGYYSFPEKGVYFTKDRVASVTINGCNVFPETTILEKIDEKYLPNEGLLRAFLGEPIEVKVISKNNAAGTQVTYHSYNDIGNAIVERTAIFNINSSITITSIQGAILQMPNNNYTVKCYYNDGDEMSVTMIGSRSSIAIILPYGVTSCSVVVSPAQE